MERVRLTHKRLHVCTRISTFRASELTATFPWASSAWRALFTRLTYTLLQNSSVSTSHTSNKQEGNRHKKTEEYRSSIAVSGRPVFRGEAHSRLWERPHVHEWRTMDFITNRSSVAEELETRARKTCRKQYTVYHQSIKPVDSHFSRKRVLK